jgi:PAS domain S-box-containing protein
VGGKRFASVVSPRRRPRVRRIQLAWLVAALLPGLSTLVTGHFQILADISFSLFYASIAVTAWFGYVRPTALAIVLSVLLSNYYITEPRGQWTFRPEELLRDAIVLVVAALIGALSIRLRKAKAALARSEAFHRTTLSSIGDAVIVTDPDGSVMFMNAAAESITGWAEGEARNRPLAAFFHLSNEETGAPVESPIEKVRRTGTVVGLANHTCLQRRDGSLIAVDDSAAPIRTPDGENIGIVLVFRDVTPRRQAEREREALLRRTKSAEMELRDALTLYQDQVTALTLAQQAGKCAAWVMDLDRQEVKWLPGGFELFGRPFADFDSRQQAISLVEPEDRPRLETAIRKTVETGAPFMPEFRVRWPNGETHWNEARGLLDPKDPRIFRGTTFDVTERKQAELALLRIEKLAAVGRIASTIAHEINNPLASVTNLLYLALLDPSLNDQVRSHLVTADAELSRLSNVTRLTLSYARPQNAAKDVPVDEVVDGIVMLFRMQLAAKSIELVRLCPEPLRVHAPQDELQRILTNLVANAIDAVSVGGTIRILAERRGGDALLAVEDNGDGIAPETIARIFDPFYTTKQDLGTDIGLWVTKELVEKNHGSVSVRSGSLDHGMSTCFELRFPHAACTRQ